MIDDELGVTATRGCPVSGELDRDLVEFMAHPHDGAPHEFFDRMRGEDDVHYSDAMQLWFMTSYDAVLALARDSRWSVDPANGSKASTSGVRGPARQLLDDMLLFRDDPAHARLRKIISPRFTKSRSEYWSEPYRAEVERVLARCEGNEPFDLVSEVSFPLALWTVCEILGLPHEDGPLLRTWTDDYVKVFHPGCTAEAEARSDTVVAEMRDYMEPLLVQRRQGLEANDLMTDFVTAERAGLLGAEEAVAYTLMMSISAHDTTASLISNSTQTLLTHRDQWSRLVDDLDLLSPAIEEIMRFENSVWMIMPRFATEDMELSGRTIRRGDQALGVLPAANRDHRHFDDPHTFDIGRSAARDQLGFGAGLHICSGQWLARIEIREYLRRLATRYPDVSLVPDQPVAYHPAFRRAPQRLLVTLGPPSNAED